MYVSHSLVLLSEFQDSLLSNVKVHKGSKDYEKSPVSGQTLNLSFLVLAQGPSLVSGNHVVSESQIKESFTFWEDVRRD